MSLIIGGELGIAKKTKWLALNDEMDFQFGLIHMFQQFYKKPKSLLSTTNSGGNGDKCVGG